MALLAVALRQQSLDIVETREPGGTVLGTKIRTILLDKQEEMLCDRAELFLFAADRAQHVAEVIKPALAQGKIVLCDRYIDSTTAYQAGGKQLDANLVQAINQQSCASLVPDLTILVDVEVDLGLSRATRVETDRFEKQNRAFHQRVRQTYLALAGQYPERFTVIDSTDLSIDTVQAMIKTQVVECLKQRTKI
jgi:dTMP kinase